MDKKAKIVEHDLKKRKEIFNMKSAQLKILTNANPNWQYDSELALIDTILNNNPNLCKIVKKDLSKIKKRNNRGRQDSPSDEQVVRAALYMHSKGLTYDELKYAQYDSKICEAFLKLDLTRGAFSKSTLQDYISCITEASLQKLLVEINKIFITEELENISKVRMDSTVVETNIHYPTNNELVWDCIKTTHRLLSKLDSSVLSVLQLKIRDYTYKAQKNRYNINVSKKNSKKYLKLFKRQLIIFRQSINQVKRVINAIEHQGTGLDIFVIALNESLKSFLPTLEKVFSITERHEILKESVPNKEKIFSIYEPHTDIIVKGSRKPGFGHKVNLVSGQASLILGCSIEKGNPSDTNLYQPALEKLESNYGIIPDSISTDGGYLSGANRAFAQKQGITNIVFNKIAGSITNITSSKKMETVLKKWRSGMEAIISNLKRGFDLRRINWKGEAHYRAKVLWSVIGYNFRTMTRRILEQLALAVE